MKKKSLLIAMAAMSVAAIGAGTVSTMAWFQAVVAGGTLVSAATASGTLTAQASAEVPAYNIYMKLTATMSTVVDPTSPTDGKVYVVANGKVVEANQSGRTYYAVGKITVEGLYYSATEEDAGRTKDAAVTNEDAQSLNGKIYTVTMSSSIGANTAGVRINTELTAATTGTVQRVVNAETPVTLGTISIAASGTAAPVYTYAKDSGNNASNEANELPFYYAFQPAHIEAAGVTANKDTIATDGKYPANFTMALSVVTPQSGS